MKFYIQQHWLPITNAQNLGVSKYSKEKKQTGFRNAVYLQSNSTRTTFSGKKYNDIGFKINKADAVISIVVNFSGMVPEWEEIAAVSMAVQNMYLTCTANEIGCYWSSPKIVDHLKESLTIEENQKCLGLFYMGQIINEKYLQKL
jgi:hypothetical protein